MVQRAHGFGVRNVTRADGEARAFQCVLGPGGSAAMTIRLGRKRRTSTASAEHESSDARFTSSSGKPSAKLTMSLVAREVGVDGAAHVVGHADELHAAAERAREPVAAVRRGARRDAIAPDLDADARAVVVTKGKRSADGRRCARRGAAVDRHVHERHLGQRALREERARLVGDHPAAIMLEPARRHARLGHGNAGARLDRDRRRARRPSRRVVGRVLDVHALLHALGEVDLALVVDHHGADVVDACRSSRSPSASRG